MPETLAPNCFVCRSPKGNWDQRGLRFLKDMGHLCQLHEALVDNKPLEEGEGMKIPGAFLPPIPKKVYKNFQDREPGLEG